MEKHLRQKLKLELNCFFSFLWLFLNKLLLICIRRLSIQKAIAQCSLHVFLPVFCFFPSLSCPFPATMKVSDDLHDLTSQLQACWSWVVSCFYVFSCDKTDLGRMVMWLCVQERRKKGTTLVLYACGCLYFSVIDQHHI